MKKRSLKLVVSLILAMTMLMGMSMTVMAAEWGSVTVDGTKYWFDEGAVSSGYDPGFEGYYRRCNTHADGILEWTDSRLVDFQECEHITTTDPTTCVHTYGGAWEATPCGTMHWQKCTKCGEYGNNQDHTAPCSVCGYGASSSSSSSTPAAPTAEQMHEEYAKAVEATVAKEEALPVTSFASEAAVKAIPAEVKADNAATLNISAVTTTQGFVATINKVAKATTAPSMAVYSAKPITMNATALNAVAKTGKTLVYTFTYKGHIYKVTIPAGAQVNTNGQMFMGPLAIGAQLGTTQVIK